MIVDKIRVEEAPGHCRLAARVRLENGPGAEHELWFQFPAAWRSQITASADAFIPALLPPAMVTESRLVIEGETCPRLRESCTQIQDILAAWVPGARRIQIEGPLRSAAPPRRDRGVGAFFSAGVDSFHTMLKNLGSITHCILIDRFDYKMLNSEIVCRDTREHAAKVAAGFGKELIVAQSNMRGLFLSTVRWDFYHGAVLAAMAHALGESFHTVLIPASYTYTQLQPWGSHPLLDPLWSTHGTRIIHDGAEATRTQKIMDWICRSDLALDSLRVCLQPGDEYNCGRCEKCVRTMIPIYLSGKLGKSRVFPREFPLEAIRDHRFTNLGQYQFAEENIALLGARPDKTATDLALISALKTSVRESRKKQARRRRKDQKRRRTWREWLRDFADA